MDLFDLEIEITSGDPFSLELLTEKPCREGVSKGKSDETVRLYFTLFILFFVHCFFLQVLSNPYCDYDRS